MQRFRHVQTIIPIALDPPVPLRSYIHESLYHPTHGYFCESNPVLPHKPDALPYQTSLHSAHRGHGWLTPVERFSPHYAQAVARRIGGGKVLEIGGGRGTLVRDMMEYWGEGDVTMVEISARLAEVQKETVGKWVGNGVDVVTADAVEWLQAGEGKDTRHIVGMEVMDNLGHDLVRVDDGVQQAYMGETGVVWGDAEDVVSDAMEVFELNSSASGWRGLLDGVQRSLDGFREIWVPTQLYRILLAIAKHGAAGMTFADFSWFGGGVAGRNAPVIQRVTDGKAVVWDNVWDAPFGKVDIMFPTDFDKLVIACDKLRIGAATHMTQPDFLEMYKDKQDGALAHDGEREHAMRTHFANANVLLVN